MHTLHFGNTVTIVHIKLLMLNYECMDAQYIQGIQEYASICQGTLRSLTRARLSQYGMGAVQGHSTASTNNTFSNELGVS